MAADYCGINLELFQFVSNANCAAWPTRGRGYFSKT